MIDRIEKWLVDHAGIGWGIAIATWISLIANYLFS